MAVLKLKDTLVTKMKDERKIQITDSTNFVHDVDQEIRLLVGSYLAKIHGFRCGQRTSQCKGSNWDLFANQYLL